MSSRRVVARSRQSNELIWMLFRSAIMLLAELLRPHFDAAMKRLLGIIVPAGPEKPDSDRPWYDILGVSEDASSQEITAAFRHHVTINHPDKVAHLSAKLIQTATEETKRINLA